MPGGALPKQKRGISWLLTSGRDELLGGEAVHVNRLFDITQRPRAEILECEAAVEAPRRLRADEDLIADPERRQSRRHVGHWTRGRIRPARARGGLELGRAHLRGARVDADMELDGLGQVFDLQVDLARASDDAERRLHGGPRVALRVLILEDDHEAVARRLVDV